MRESDIAYLAGLFDGEGSLQCKKGWEKKKKHKGEGHRMSNSMRISMEIAMTDEAVIRWVHETLQVGSVIKRNVKGLNKAGKKYKTQWRWRCTFREAYYVCRLIWPYVQVKLHKVEQLIDHYSPDHVFDGKVVNLQQYREAMNLE
jgi:hypothetical protein|tara:strand:+ start:246 stop:680 length:435 start_codon:yes stop_codon:yes gene_type:complete